MMTKSAMAQPPHSVESEEAVLGSILIDQEAFYSVSSFLKPRDFYITKNGWVFEAMIAIRDRKEEIDYLTLVEELRRVGRLDEIGGAAYITFLINVTPATIYAETYGRIVKRTAIRRYMLEAASEFARLAHDEESDLDQAIEKGDQYWQAVKDQRTVSTSTIITLEEAAKENYERVEKAATTGSTGIPTGYTDIDELTGGLQPAEVTVIGGRPGQGKTAWLLSLALQGMQAKRPEHVLRPHLVTFEMLPWQLAQRWSAMLATGDQSLSVREQRTGKVDLDALKDVSKKLGAFPGTLDYIKPATPYMLQRSVRAAVDQYGANCVMIDYLTLMDADGENQNLKVSAMMRAIKSIAVEFKLHVIVAAQLNRGVEQRQDKRPVMSDLRDSGTIEENADTVFLLYRDAYYNPKSEKPNVMDCIVGKNRNGPTGSVPLHFNPDRMRVSNLAVEVVDVSGLTNDAHSERAIGSNGNGRTPAPVDLEW